jgi:hypothetical protein
MLVGLDKEPLGQRLVGVLRDELKRQERISPAIDGRICVEEEREQCGRLWQVTAPWDGGIPGNGDAPTTAGDAANVPDLAGTDG